MVMMMMMVMMTTATIINVSFRFSSDLKILTDKDVSIQLPIKTYFTMYDFPKHTLISGVKNRPNTAATTTTDNFLSDKAVKFSESFYTTSTGQNFPVSIIPLFLLLLNNDFAVKCLKITTICNKTQKFQIGQVRAKLHCISQATCVL